ncbi:MAG: hypothetical protein KL787_03655 [Taibaiella sp.]|nr:hypothetical protein [Taibaiella sp.]
MKSSIIAALLIYFCSCDAFAQNVLLKGNNTSMVNLYGNPKLGSIALTQNPKKQITNYTAQGYKLLLYFGKDKSEAQKTKTDFGRSHSGIGVGIQFSSPNYSVKAGDFEKRDEAQSFLESIQTSYPNAVIVSDQINITVK